MSSDQDLLGQYRTQIHPQHPQHPQFQPQPQPRTYIDPTTGQTFVIVPHYIQPAYPTNASTHFTQYHGSLYGQNYIYPSGSVWPPAQASSTSTANLREATSPGTLPSGINPAHMHAFETHPGYSPFPQFPPRHSVVPFVAQAPQPQPQPTGPLRLVIGIDFGTTYSGIAFADANAFLAQANQAGRVSGMGPLSIPPESYVRLIQKWPNCGNQASSQVPTEISYTDDAAAQGSSSSADANTSPSTTNTASRTQLDFSWGADIPGSRERLKWFKLALEHPDELIRTRYPLPKDITILDVVTDFLSALHKHALEQIRLEMPKRALRDATIEYVVTVPAVWSELALRRTEEAARRAGLAPGPIDSAILPGVNIVSKGLHLMPEPEAAALYLLRNQHMSPNQRQVVTGETMLVCDAGGGTVDLVTYEIESLYPALKVREAAVGTGDLCGSTFIDQNFTRHFEKRMGPVEYANLRPSQRQAVVKNFELVKCAFADAPHHPRYHVQVPGRGDLPEAGIIGGEFELSREEMRELFEPVVRRVLGLIEEQVEEVRKGGTGTVHVILLVGGFGESPYLYKIVKAWAKRRGIAVLQPGGSSTAIVKGACLRGIETACSSHAISKADTSQVPSISTQLVNITRRARKNYGILHAAVFVPGLHDESQAFYDKITKQKLINNRITWFVQKGRTVSDDLRLPHGFFRRFRHLSTWTATLVTCALDEAPNSMVGEGGVKSTHVEVLCHLTADLTAVPKELFTKKRRFFRKYYEADYEIAMVVGGGGLRFELLYQGQTYGAVGAEYVNQL